MEGGRSTGIYSGGEGLYRTPLIFFSSLLSHQLGLLQVLQELQLQPQQSDRTAGRSTICYCMKPSCQSIINPRYRNLTHIGYLVTVVDLVVRPDRIDTLQLEVLTVIVSFKN